MDGIYQLVFSGEVVAGQHRGVVKRRLKKILELDDAQVEKLFTGKPVVVKRDVDEATAEKYKELFKKAGAQLQVVATEEASDAAETDTTDLDVADAGTTKAAAIEEVPTVVPEANFEVAEVGSDMLDEPAVVVAPKIKDVDFDVADVGADIGDRDDTPPPPAPDVSHIKLVD